MSIEVLVSDAAIEAGDVVISGPLTERDVVLFEVEMALQGCKPEWVTIGGQRIYAYVCPNSEAVA